MDDTGTTNRRKVLLEALAALDAMQKKLDTAENAHRAPIAIVGMGCRFPGGGDGPEAFWEFVQNGGDAIAELPANRWEVDKYYDPDPEAAGKMYTRSGGFLKDIDLFDAHFFGISPREAVGMDPQQRLLLEVSWEALENAGYSPDQLAGSNTGVYVGITLNDYGYLQKRGGTKNLNAYDMTGNHLNFAAGRIAYTLGLQGPAMAVDTACSSSLVTIHLACQQLRFGECRMALAAGVNLILTPMEFIMASKARMLSPDGRCKTFDARADGFGRGEGCGVVLLKRLEDAQRDGDNIHAVIRGSAVNQDGASSGLTVPNVLAQQDLIRKALQNAGLKPEAVQYIEAHGTGTALGDPIEVRALDAVFAKTHPSHKPLLIGSVKTNIGHLESASGMAGVIKVVMALKNEKIPASLNFTQPNPHIDWDRVCVAVPVSTASWPDRLHPLIAGVSSFGASGSNAHALIEAAPRPPAADVREKRPLHVLALSAQSREALSCLRHDYCRFLEKNPGISLADACFTANSGRKHFSFRQTFVAADIEAMRQALEEKNKEVSGHKEEDVNGPILEPGIVFIFTGQGSQYEGMGRRLYETQPVFRKVMNRCEDLFEAQSGRSLLSVLYPKKPGAGEEGALLNQTGFAQPALFALEYALYQLWLSWGIEPAAVMGHSVGEYVAACAAGIFSLEDGFKLISLRARLMQALPPGGTMAAAFTDEMRLQAVLAARPGCVDIAAVNGPRNVVFSGRESDVELVAEALATEGLRSVRLNVSHAFHSSLMEPMLEEFRREAADIAYGAPRIVLISNVTGRIFSSQDLPDAEYWCRHIRQPVRFQDSIQELYRLGYRTFLEVGPQPVLSGMGAQSLEDPALCWLPSLRRGNDDWREMLSSLGTLYRAGARVDWSGFDRDYRRRRIPLPTYPFQRQRYWLRSTASEAQRHQEGHPLLAGGIRSPLLPGVLFEARLTTGAYPYLKDHCIAGTTIVPATLFIEMIAAGAKQIVADRPAVLKDIVFHQAVLLEEEERRLQLIFDPPDHFVSNFKLICLDVGTPGQEPPWHLIASGMVAHDVHDENPDRPGDDTIRIISERCPREIEGNDLYGQLRNFGYQFGEAFMGIQQVQFNDREALGRILPLNDPGSRSEAYLFQPALLDACFQVCAVTWLKDLQNDPYIPVSVEEIQFHRRPEGKLWSHAVVHQGVSGGTDEIKTAEITVFDDTCAIVAKVTNIVFKRTVAASLFHAGRRDISRWLYQINWKQVPVPEKGALGRPATFLPDPMDLAAGAASLIPEFDRELGFSGFGGMFPELDQLCTAFILAALGKLGWKPVVGAGLDAAQLAQELGIVPKHNRLWVRLLEILNEDGLLRGPKGAYAVGAFSAARDPEERIGTLLKRFPYADAEISMTAHIGRNLGEALTGRKDPVELLFPDGSTAMAEKLYRHSPYLAFYNRIIRQVVLNAQSALPPNRNLRVLEIGAGTGGTTSHVLPCLDPRRTEYTYTDVSTLFLSKARKKFEAYPFVRYKLLDIEVDPLTQDYLPHQFDLIIAANVLHATCDLRTTVDHVRRLLAPLGLLVLLEGTRPQRFADMIVGLTEGWWKFADTGLRPSYPLISGQQWTELLSGCGFSGATTVPGTGLDQALFSSQAVILARGPKAMETGTGIGPSPTDTRGRWILFADRQGLARNLARKLEGDGRRTHFIYADNGPPEAPESAHITVIDSSEVEDFRTLWKMLEGDPAPIHGVVYLWGLDQEIRPDAEADTLERSIASGTAGALHLVQALADAATPSKVWLITRGAQHLAEEPTAVALPQSTFWGFGRTVMLEHPELNCTLVDLPEGMDDQTVDMLYREVHTDDDENQVAWRDNARYAARLNPADESRQSRERRQRLVNRTPGDLEGLGLVPMDRLRAGRNQVEVRIRATGLNFRDVLMALDLYPGENSPLGIECAGTVESMGADVHGFELGDEVIAIAPGSFATTALADYRLMIRKPVDMSHEEAASIPSVFLTAHYALEELARLQAGERVLIHAATGGVGMAALQVAKHAGAEIFATAGSDTKRQFLRSLGIKNVYDSRSLSFAAEIMASTEGAGVHVVINSLSGDFVPKSLSVLGQKGRFIEIGRRGIWTADQVGAFRADITYCVVNLLELCHTEPALIQRLLVSVMGRFAANAYRLSPIKTYSLGKTSSAFRQMAQAKHMGKIVVTQPFNRRLTGDLPVSRQGSYLITGGLSGLGLLVAGWLARKGAGHLVLMGRRQPEGDNLSAVTALEETGTRISVIAGDVSRMQDLRRAVEALTPTCPLKGVIHCAGTLHDGVLVKQTWERFATVMAAKVSGSWNLHQLTRKTHLDFFVMFSSAVSVLGSAGQANHAAACAFEDALAAYRLRLGLPAVSINWGPWADIGAAASRMIDMRWQAQGIFQIKPQKGLLALEEILARASTQIAVLDASWTDFIRQQARTKPVPFLSELIATATPRNRPKSQAEQTPELLLNLEGQVGQEEIKIIHQFVLTIIRRVLELEPDFAIGPKQGLSDLGMDSLLSIELKNHLQRGTGLMLPATLAFDYPTPEALAALIASKLLTSRDAAAQKDQIPATRGSADRNDIDNLSDDEAEAMLLNELGVDRQDNRNEQ